MAPKLPPTLRASLLCSFMFNQTQISINPLPSIPITNYSSTFLQPNPSYFSPNNSFLSSSRSFSSSLGSGDILFIGSEQEFSTALSKALDDKLPTVFYFTATWCPPCKMLSPVVAEMSKKYPHVKTYKIDIDQDGLQSILSKHSISSVPTLYFYQDGKKADQMVGADLNGFKRTMENLYKKE